MHLQHHDCYTHNYAYSSNLQSAWLAKYVVSL